MKAAIRTQVHAGLRGHRVETIAAGIVGMYNSRMRLAKLGYTEDISSLDAHTADCFVYISSVVDDEADKIHKKGR